MGAADVVPGVSGGTMAFILGIYERLLSAVRSFDIVLLTLLLRGEPRAAARHADLGFLVALGLGIGSALLFFTRIVPLPRLIHTDPVPVFSLFFGLVSASIVTLLRHLDGFNSRHAGLLVAGAALGFIIVNLVPMETPETLPFVALSGALAVMAMILPGVSGSFVLLMLRKYGYVFDAIGKFDLSVLIPFAGGAALGLALFSRLLVWLLGRFRTAMLATIIGVLIGSLWMIWPFQERAYEIVRGKERLVASAPVLPWGAGEPLGTALLWALAGVAAVLVVELLARRRSV